MKKIVCLFLSFLLFALAVGCSSGVSQEEYDALKKQLEEVTGQVVEPEAAPAKAQTESSPSQSDDFKQSAGKKSTTGFNEEEALAQLVVQEYHYMSSIKTPWVFLVVKNASKYNLRIEGSIKTYDESGSLLGAQSSSQEAVECGYLTILTFMLDEPFSNVEYEMSVEEEDTYDCVLSDLAIETTSAKKKEVVSVTNNGEEAAEFVECKMLFFEGDDLIGYTSNYFVDDDHEIKPGKTITEEMSCYESYDSIIYAFTGRR